MLKTSEYVFHGHPAALGRVYLWRRLRLGKLTTSITETNNNEGDEQ